MSHDERRISVGNGKYTFFIPEKDWRPNILRHGEPWHVVEEGCNAVASLMSELIEARKLIKETLAWQSSGDTSLDGLRAKRCHENLDGAINAYRSAMGINQ